MALKNANYDRQRIETKIYFTVQFILVLRLGKVQQFPVKQSPEEEPGLLAET
jgi:hypothetical protein